jgi:tRNA wybutosine-synthesizing protein 4
MLKHFEKLQTPIYAVKDYSSLDLQRSRFTSAGWTSIDIGRNLWDLWLDDSFTPPTLRHSLDAVEPFDEWEEFALFAGHYFLIVASNRERKDLRDLPSRSGTDPKTNSIVMQCDALIPGVIPRRFGAVFTQPRGAVAVHGGQGVQRRLTSIDVLSRSSSEEIGIQPPPTPLSRICHTITSLNGSEALLVGGRQSPSDALPECWLLKDESWRKVGELRPGRFRHSSTRVKVPLLSNSEVEGVLVVGGKTSDGTVLDECCIWLPNQGWQILPVTGTRPCARFGAAISSMSEGNGGVLLGGMSSDGTVLDDIWEYNISAAPHIQLHFKDRTNDIRCKHHGNSHARFGASLVPFGNSLLLMGGISAKDILSLADEFLIISAGGRMTVEKVTVNGPPNMWPLLVGCNALPVSEDEVLVLGGGAVCFSMGSFWNQGCFSIAKSEIPDRLPWNVSTCQPNPEDAGQGGPSKVTPLSKSKRKAKGKGKGKGNPKAVGEVIGKTNTNSTSEPKAPTTGPTVSTVPRIQLQSAEDFARLVTDSKPAIIQGLDLGPCTTLWTLDYLKDTLGTEREIVIHDSSSDRMTFKDKNFTYTKTTMGAFIDGISSGAKRYLRAVSASQPNKLPTKLEDDFPELASDFRLPPEILAEVQNGYHSSPLRISGPVSLWLHYDVLANVLSQIQGSKTLRLYPPSDASFLGYPPGGSSSNLDASACQDSRLHPHVASLHPGDVLFIPPMWSHTATPEEGHSVAVNVFWRNLDKGYAAGKDVYGNRDLQAYETGRRDVEKILKAFRGLPADLSGFYIDRLANELQDRGNKLGA